MTHFIARSSAAIILTAIFGSTTFGQMYSVTVNGEYKPRQAPVRNIDWHGQGQYQQQNQMVQNYGYRQQMDYQYRNQISHQNPRAALVGGILGAIAGGLQSGDAQKNAGAVNVLGSLSNTFGQLSGPQYQEQSRYRFQQQGYHNQMQNQTNRFSYREGYSR